MSKNWLRSTAIALALGAKNADIEMTGQVSSIDAKEIQQAQQSNVLNDILDGKLTKQVQEYRYRHYAILREASRKMRSKERRELTDLVVDPYDLYEVEMGIITKNVNAGLIENNVNKKYTNIVIENPSTNISIERFSEKLIVRNINNEYKLIEIWFNKSQAYDPETEAFMHKMRALVKAPEVSPLINIHKIGFLTQSAYGVDDFLYYEYDIKSLFKVVDYKNHYILKYVAIPLINGEDILDKFYDKDAANQIISEKSFFQNNFLNKNRDIL